MENTSTVTYFALTGYIGMEKERNIYMWIFILLYILTIVSNSTLIGVIYVDRSLHKPMFLFLCSLSLNGIYGSTTLIPHLVSNLASQIHQISLIFCLCQIYCLHTFAIIEFTVLAVMGIDRYTAICHPLLYHNIMSPRRIYFLIAFSWLYPLVLFGCYLILTIRLKFCHSQLDKVYCANFELIKLSCSDTSINDIVGLLTIPFFMLPQVITVLFSYAKILQICLRSSRECKLKALQTCTPHLLAFINYSLGCFFEITQSRFNMSKQSYELKTFMALYFIIFPPLLNPIVYGTCIKTIKESFFKTFCRGRKIACTKKRG